MKEILRAVRDLAVSIAIVFAVIFAFNLLSSYLANSSRKAAEKRAAIKSACMADPKCWAKEMNDKARFESIGSNFAVTSAAGVSYFKGDACRGDCSGHIAGYLWAEKLGISKKEGCSGRSQSFIEGCIQYAADRVSELQGHSGSGPDDDGPSCTPGRYGDC